MPKIPNLNNFKHYGNNVIFIRQNKNRICQQYLTSLFSNMGNIIMAGHCLVHH